MLNFRLRSFRKSVFELVSSLFSKEKQRYSCPEGFHDVTDRCYLNTYDTIFKKIRGFLEVVLVIWSIGKKYALNNMTLLVLTALIFAISRNFGTKK